MDEEIVMEIVENLSCIEVGNNIWEPHPGCLGLLNHMRSHRFHTKCLKINNFRVWLD